MFRKIVKSSIYLLVFLMPIFWLSFSFEAFDFNKVYLLFFFTALGIVAWLGEMIFEEKRLRFRRTPLDFFVLGFALIMILSTVFSVDKVSSLLGTYGRFWPSLIGVLSLCGFYFLISNYVSFEKQQKEEKKLIRGMSLINVFLISSALIVLTSYLSIFGFFGKLARMGAFAWIPPVLRANGFNPAGGTLESLSIFLAFIVVLIVTAISFRKRIVSIFTSKLKTTGFYILLFASLVLLIIIDFSAAWLVLVISLLAFLVVSFWKRIFKQEVHRLNLPIVFMIIAFVFIFGNPLSGVLKEVATFNDLPSEILPSQELSWTVGLHGVKSNLIIGSGPSTFNYLFNRFKPKAFLQNPGDLWRLRLNRSSSHISEVLGTGGILGTLSYLFLIGVFFLLFYFYLDSLKQKSKKSDGDGDEEGVKSSDKFIAIPLFAGGLALFLGQVFYYQNVVLAFSFWLILSLGVLSLSREVKRKEFSFKDFPEIGLVLSILFWVISIAFIFFCFSLGKYYIADTYYRDYLEKPTISVQKLETATRLADKRAIYHVMLAGDYWTRFNEEMAKQDPSPQIVANMAALALQEARRATEVSPNMVLTQETLSIVYRDIQGVAQGALEWSLKSFESAVKLEPRNPILLTELGKLVAVTDIERARGLFQDAIELKGNYLDAHMQLALLIESQGNTEEARTILENAVLLNPQRVEARFQLGRVYYNNQEDEKAKREFEVALAIFPNHSNSIYSLAMIYEREGNNKEAISLMEKVLALNPGNTDVAAKLSELRNTGGSVLPPQPVKPTDQEEAGDEIEEDDLVE